MTNPILEVVERVEKADLLLTAETEEEELLGKLIEAKDADTLCRFVRLAMKCARHAAFCPKGKVYAVGHPMHGRKVYCDETCGYDQLRAMIGGED